MENNGINLTSLTLGPYGTNAYIIIDKATQDSILIDAPDEPSTLLKKLSGSKPSYIIVTHNHFDHTGALKEIKQKLNIPIIVHSADSDNLPVRPNIIVYNETTVYLGKTVIRIFNTPGHTPGSICLLTGRYLISGDTIFPGGPGHTASPDSFKQIVKSITEKIFTLPDNTEIYPGHGEKSILSEEKQNYLIFSSKKSKPDLYGDVLWS